LPPGIDLIICVSVTATFKKIIVYNVIDVMRGCGDGNGDGDYVAGDGMRWGCA